MNMNAFIAENYDVTFVGDQVEFGNLSSAKEFILTYTRETPSLEETNALFINTFVQENNKVLITNIPAHRHIQPSEHIATLWIKKGIDIYGCDCDLEQRVQSEFFNKLNKISLQFYLIMKNFLTCPTEEKEIFEKRLFQNMEEALYMRTDNFVEKLNKLLPDRVDSMLEALERLSAKTERVFLVVEKFFFEEGHKKTSPKSYNALCKNLKNRSVVVLTPKSSDFTKPMEKAALLNKMREISLKFFEKVIFEDRTLGKAICDENTHEPSRKLLYALRKRG
jgi:hypothetical protein